MSAAPPAAPAPAGAAAATGAAPGPATWVGVDGEVTLFSPRVGACLRLDGPAAAQLVAVGSTGTDGQGPSDPLVRLACAGAAPVGAHVTGPLAPRGSGASGPRASGLQAALTAAALAVPAGQEPLAWLARHRMTGHLWPVRATLPGAPAGALAGSPGSPPGGSLAAGVAAAHAAMLERRLRALSDLAAWAAVVDAASVPWLLAKGLATAAAYPRPDARTFGDLDVLVAPGDLGPVLDVLARAGWRLADRNHLLLRRVVPSEVHLVGPAGTVVDLHWSMTSTRVRARGVGTSTAALMDRATAVDVGGLVVPALHPADALVHLCVHAAASGADRLGWLADVAAAAPADDAGWRDVTAAAQRWHARAAVAGVLDRAARALGREALGRAAPGGEALGGHGATAVTAAAAARGPVGRTVGRCVARSVEELSPVAVSTGVGSGASRLARSWVGIAPRPLDALRAVAGRALGSRPQPFVDGEGEPGSALHPTGTAADLAAFCAEVAARDGAPQGRARRGALARS